MSGPLPCDLCATAEAVFLVTFMPNGDSLTLCWGCVPAWAETLTAAADAAGVDAAAVAEGDTGLADPHTAKLRRPPKGRQAAAKRRPPRPSAKGGPEAPGAAEGAEDAEQAPAPSDEAGPTDH